MPAVLAIALGTACVAAAVLLFMTGYTQMAAVAAAAGLAFDLLFVRTLARSRRIRVAQGSAGGPGEGPAT
jgi:hypothetical protein